ncbi:MAG: rhodanese-like domain-containing protein [bacterium]
MKLRRLIGIPFLIALVTAFTFGCAPAIKQPVASKTEMQAKDQAEPKWQFHDIVDGAYVKPFVTIPRPQGVLLIDARPTRSKFDKGYIPTAINIPDSNFAEMTDQLPSDKGTLLIFYCEGAS